MTLAKEYLAIGGVEYAKNLLKKSLNPEQARKIIDRLMKYLGTGSGFDTMQKTDPKILSKFIQKEHPQTIALILSHMDLTKASSTMGSLPKDLQVEVAERMANLEEFSPEVVNKISNVLQKKLETLTSSSVEIHGVKTVAEMLNRMNRTDGKVLLEKLDEKDPDLATNIKQLMFVFEDIQFVDDKAIQEILKRIDKKALTLALKGTHEQLKEKFFKNMSMRAVEAIKEEMEFMGPVKIVDVGEAQNTITDVARQLEEEGTITLGGGEEAEFVT
jgi:flagellar motor switch protein FliG